VPAPRGTRRAANRDRRDAAVPRNARRVAEPAQLAPRRVEAGAHRGGARLPQTLRPPAHLHQRVHRGRDRDVRDRADGRDVCVADREDLRPPAARRDRTWMRCAGCVRRDQHGCGLEAIAVGYSSSSLSLTIGSFASRAAFSRCSSATSSFCSTNLFSSYTRLSRSRSFASVMRCPFPGTLRFNPVTRGGQPAAALKASIRSTEVKLRGLGS
jgi:hypothetical protein